MLSAGSKGDTVPAARSGHVLGSARLWRRWGPWGARAGPRPQAGGWACGDHQVAPLTPTMVGRTVQRPASAFRKSLCRGRQTLHREEHLWRRRRGLRERIERPPPLHNGSLSPALAHRTWPNGPPKTPARSSPNGPQDTPTPWLPPPTVSCSFLPPPHPQSGVVTSGNMVTIFGQHMAH